MPASPVIPDETLAQIRDRADIVTVVGEYVPLKRAGSSFKGLCPFHAEKSPSFHVNPERKFFHCFGCGASGDVIKFVMTIDGLPFRDAVERLAARTGVEIPETTSRDDVEQRQARQRRERLHAVMDSAHGYFVESLRTHRHAGQAREVIRGRKVTAESVERFGLGYAPFGFDGLTTHLERAGHDLDEATELGLLVRRDRGGYFDRFRHRVMFAIRDPQGYVVAFSGRALPDPEGEPVRPGDPPAKYINSPETPLYKKGDILYGLFEGRVALRREGFAVVCEGNFDLVKLHQGGFQTAVAPMGTAFTPQQAALLRRFVSKAYLVFDGDAAGRKAVRASFGVLGAAGIASHVVTLPDGDDPDSFLGREGDAALREKLTNAPTAVAHFIDDAAVRAVADPTARARAIVDLGPIIASVESQVERRLWIERIAQRFGVHDLEAVRRQLLAGARDAKGDSAARGDAQAPHAPRPVESERPTLAHELVGACLDHPPLLLTEAGRTLEELLTRADLRAIVGASSRMYEALGHLDGPALAGNFAGSPAEGWLRERITRPVYDEGGATRVLNDGIARLGVQTLELEVRQLKERILEARRRGDDAAALELTRTLTERTQTAQRLRKKPTRG